jgi:hypothetical protein
MFLLSVAVVIAVLVLMANPVAQGEPYDDLPVTPVTRSNTESCRLVIDDSMKRIKDHCGSEVEKVVDIPTSSPHLNYPRIKVPTTAPSVYNPLGRPLYHPPAAHNPVYNNITSTPAPMMSMPSMMSMPPMMPPVQSTMTPSSIASMAPMEQSTGQPITGGTQTPSNAPLPQAATVSWSQV